MKKFLQRDSVLFGVVLATVLPLALFAAVYIIWYCNAGSEYLRIAFVKNLPKIFTLCVFPNGLVFYFYTARNKMLTMRGMVIGTVFMALVMTVIFLLV
jgi:hypothetical protein